jgi:hypothetical protein
MRPVIGRLPMLTGAGAVVAGAAVQASGVAVDDPRQLADVIGIVATLTVFAAVAVGAVIVADARTSGMDATDRLMVGRPRWISAGLLVAIAAWAAAIAVALGTATIVVLGVGAAIRREVHDLAAWAEPVAAAMVRMVAAAAAAAASGGALAQLVRSPAAAIAGFLGMLVVGDPLLVSAFPGIEPALLADNLLALASTEMEGLAVRSLRLEVASVAAVVAAVGVAAVGALVDARRDLDP